VTAYAAARRTAEIGIRMALGAGRSHLVWLVLRDTLRLALAGLIAGTAMALWGVRYMKSLLFGIGPADVPVIAATIAALVLVAALAGCLPARRAMRIGPKEALRHE
jgi:ABC-type antimicrobial peptide transport system permease subunit